MTGTARAILRDGTDAAHRALDARMAALDLSRRADLAALLRVNAAAHLPLEAALDAAREGQGPDLADWPDRRRADALRADLAGLGQGVPLPVTAALEAGWPERRAEMLGVLYVLEGSRLGGAVLARAAGPGASRFLTHGAGQGLWPRLLPVLEAGLAAPAARAAALDAARATFAAFAAAASREMG